MVHVGQTPEAGAASWSCERSYTLSAGINAVCRHCCCSCCCVVPVVPGWEGPSTDAALAIPQYCVEVHSWEMRDDSFQISFLFWKYEIIHYLTKCFSSQKFSAAGHKNSHISANIKKRQQIKEKTSLLMQTCTRSNIIHISCNVHILEKYLKPGRYQHKGNISHWSPYKS